MSDVHSRTELQANDDSHRHVCTEVPKQSASVCSARGYCLCECGAMKGTNCLSEWVAPTAAVGWPDGEMYR
jgi:hypothetical protein